ncbi:MAG: PaaI family thioesterase [Chloroflexi bacterium]|nr:PaaI family thioesterase [Chloroflexota bacterium]
MKKQPTSNHCFVCGRKNPLGLHLDFYELDSGAVQAEISVPDYYQGYPGVVHGGVLAAMLDETIGRVFMTGDPPRFMYTVQLAIRYRKPVPTGEPIQVIGRAVRDNGRVANAEGEILDEAGTVLVEAKGVYVNVPQETLASLDAEALGWQVYPGQEELA